MNQSQVFRPRNYGEGDTELQKGVEPWLGTSECPLDNPPPLWPWRPKEGVGADYTCGPLSLRAAPKAPLSHASPWAVRQPLLCEVQEGSDWVGPV